jgi:hypothetical protein
VRASVRVEAGGVIVGTDLSVAIGARRVALRAVGSAVVAGAWLGLLLAALSTLDGRPAWPAAVLGFGFGALGGGGLGLVLHRRPAAGVTVGRYELRVDPSAAHRVRAGLLRAKGELGEMAVIPAAAPGRRAPAYPAGDPRASAEELLGLAAPAPRG